MTDVKVNWFEIPVRNVDRAQAFYAALLDRKMGEIDGPNGKMRIFESANGPEGTIFQGDRGPGADGVRIYLHCPDIDGALARCSKAGGKVDEGKSSIGPFGHIAVIKEPDDNRIGLHFGG